MLFNPLTLLASAAFEHGIYVAGIVRDTNNAGVRNAIVVITDRHNKIISLRTAQQGWFELPSPLDAKYFDKELRVTIIKNGYHLKTEPIKIEGRNNFYNLTLVPVEDYSADSEYSTYETQVQYGYVFDKDTGMPIRGALITVLEDQKNAPVASAVSRDSGYFSLYHEPPQKDRKYRYSIEHYTHDTRKGSFAPNSEDTPFPLEMEQNRFSFALGPALHYQTTFTTADKESGGALLINLSWYPDEVVVVDNYFPRYQRSGLIGYDVGVGVVPFRSTSPSADEVEYIKLLSVGGSFAFGGFMLPVRMGLSYSDTDKTAVYIGLNIPIYYF